MKYKGINYDTGTRTLTGGLTRDIFTTDIVCREIEIIRNELHCNAIRISGVYIERNVKAAEIALKMRLTVWFSPSLPYKDQAGLSRYILEAAAAAEKLRLISSSLVFVIGCEFSVFTSGFVKGGTGYDRMKNLFSPLSLLKNTLGVRRTYNRRLNKFLAKIVGQIRHQFHGQITYASGTWEKINWRLFDIAGVDLYRSVYNKATYLKELRKYQQIGKPLAITEFGCCAYKGADDKGAMGWAIVDWNKKIPELKDEYDRNEEVQSKYIIELLNNFENEDVFACFIFTFISYNYIYNDNPRYDLDMASYGIVRSMQDARQGYYKGLPWIPKQAFFVIGDFYRNQERPSPISDF